MKFVGHSTTLAAGSKWFDGCLQNLVGGSQKLVGRSERLVGR